MTPEGAALPQEYCKLLIPAFLRIAYTEGEINPEAGE
jgi:hypothetical protein